MSWGGAGTTENLREAIQGLRRFSQRSDIPIIPIVVHYATI